MEYAQLNTYAGVRIWASGGAAQVNKAGLENKKRAGPQRAKSSLKEQLIELAYADVIDNANGYERRRAPDLR
jgi:hypothetical protein